MLKQHRLIATAEIQYIYTMKPAIIGITGGIGSGKSIVARIFATLNVPVFNADDEAKSLYTTNAGLIHSVKVVFGDQVFTGEVLDKQKLAALVFSDLDALKKLNQLVHPLVKERFEQWYATMQSSYVLREAAILIESGSYKDCSSVILVTAAEQTRIERVVRRNHVTETEVRRRMSNQWTDEQKRPFTGFEISNNDDDLIVPQILNIHRMLMA